MSKNKITVHTIVKNDDRFIWYSLSSILPYADEVFVCDTGSTDQTYKIIKTFDNPKIILESKKSQNREDITRLRQEQLKNTQGGFIWLVDGDEIYPRTTAQEIRELVDRPGERQIEGIVVRRHDLLGDVFHYQDDSAGYYRLFGQKGHFALRLINLDQLPGLHLSGTYPLEGYYDRFNQEIIHHDPVKYVFTNGFLFHASYLKRSSAGNCEIYNRHKYKVEKGLPVDSGKIPEVLNSGKRPDFVPLVTIKRNLMYEIEAMFLTPLKKIKRYFREQLTKDVPGDITIFGLNELAIGKVYGRWIFSILKPFIKLNVLEIGAGLGNYTGHYPDGGRIILSDVDKRFVSLMKKKYAGRSDIKVMALDITKPDNGTEEALKSEKINTVIAVNVFEHIKDDLQALKNCYRLLPPGSRLLIFVPALPSIFGSIDEAFGHYRRYTKKELTDKIRLSGFKVISVRYFNIIGIIWWFVMGKVVKAKNLPLSTGLFLKIVVPVIERMEKLASPPVGQSLIAVAEKE